MAFGTRAPSTITVINLSGQKDFTIPFEYLARKFVVVTLLGKDRLLLTLNKDYRFTSKTNINVTANIDTSRYTQIEIRRVTSATERLVDFHDGSILRANDLNVSQIQTLHVAEEARDLASDSIGVNDDGDLDARNRKIINLADGTNPMDAVNLRQLSQYDTSTLNNANKAQASANAAKTSETNAKTSETNAKTSENNAKTHEASAKAWAEKAKTSETNAKTSETNAKTSETNSKNSETAAKNSQNAAKTHEDNAKAHADRADSAKNVVVDALEATGNVPVGTIAMVAHNVSTPPVGWLFCGTSFNTSAYPALAKLFPNGQIPSFENRFPIGAGSVTGVGAHGDQALPTHTHSVSVSGNVSTVAQAVYNTTSNGEYSSNTVADGTHTHTTSLSHNNHVGAAYSSDVGYGRKSAGGNYAGTYPHASNSTGHHYHRFSVPNHTHSVTVPAHNHTFSYSGDSGSTGRGDRVLPYNVGVKYIIKAYEGVSELDEALVVVGKIDARVAALENRVTILENVKPVAIGAATAEGVNITTDGGGGYLTTNQFVEWLKGQGAFRKGCWSCRTMYYFARTGTINDTGCGNINLAGSVIEVFSNTTITAGDAFTIRITSESTVSSGTGRSVFWCSKSSEGAPVLWSRVYDTSNKPTAYDVKAQPLIVNPDVLLETTNYLTSATTYHYRDVDYLSKLRVHVGSIPKFTTLEEIHEDGTTTLEEVPDGEETTLDTHGAVLELFRIVHDLQARIRELEAK